MKCIACDAEQTLNWRFVALKRGVNLCLDCLDAAHEVAHEAEGMATISTRDLETMRRNSFIGANAAEWVNLVRRAVAQADASLRAPTEEQAGEAHPDQRRRQLIVTEYVRPPIHQHAAQVAAAAVQPIRDAVNDYHLALDLRKHGRLAMVEAFKAIERALGMKWVAGAAIRARKEPS